MLTADLRNKDGVSAYGGGGATKYTQSFAEADLTNGKITIVHNLNTEDVIVSVYDSDKEQIIPDKITILTADTLEINLLAFSPLIDNYKVIVI